MFGICYHYVQVIDSRLKGGGESVLRFLLRQLSEWLIWLIGLELLGGLTIVLIWSLGHPGKEPTAIIIGLTTASCLVIATIRSIANTIRIYRWYRAKVDSSGRSFGELWQMHHPVNPPGYWS